MDSVLTAIDQRRAELTTELAKLDAARAALAPSRTSTAAKPGAMLRMPMVVPSQKKDAAPTAPGESKPKGKRQQRPAMGAETLAQARSMIRAVLSVQGPKTPKQLEGICQMAPWKVCAALKDWAEVEHTTPSMKSPYRLKSS